MAEGPATEVVTTWFGVFAVAEGRVVLAKPFPKERATIRDRWKVRGRGGVVPEEEALIREVKAQGASVITSRDRRLFPLGLHPGFASLPEILPSAWGIDPAWEREISLEAAQEDLTASWDPSIHVEEAVRALADLDNVLNLLGERLASWGGREALGEPDTSLETARQLAHRWTSDDEGGDEGSSEFAPDETLGAARRELARAWTAAEAAHKALEAALEEDVPRRYPNLNSLLGPLLAARLISVAGGLARLSRLPSSTVQVLGAERAFFDHLRGHGPPPRHGLLFLHPSLHTAPRYQRGRIARALAGKVAIAARRDLQGSPPLESLKTTFEGRLENIRTSGRPRTSGTGRREPFPPRGSSDPRGRGRPPRDHRPRRE